MRCDFSESRGDGTYSLLCSLFIPSGSGLATVEFSHLALRLPAVRRVPAP
jgi:hypothetical protein